VLPSGDPMPFDRTPTVALSLGAFDKRWSLSPDWCGPSLDWRRFAFTVESMPSCERALVLKSRGVIHVQPREGVMQYKGYSIATKGEGDHWVGKIRRLDGKDITIDGATLHTFTTMKACSSDDAVKLASQAIDSGKLGPVEIA
jgi:hypothetical protein